MKNESEIDAINSAPLAYWRATGYEQADLDHLCQRIDKELMYALVSFEGDATVRITISSKTWQRQEGHYPTITNFFRDVAQHPAGRNLRGSVIVWLEDGMWDEHRDFARGAPVLSFGRHRNDRKTLLIPDPAFLEDKGYSNDRAEVRAIEQHHAGREKHRTIYWRGAATGIGIEGPEWRSTPRGRLVLTSREIDDPRIVDAKITRTAHLTPEQHEVMAQEGVLGDPIPFSAFLAYKYLLDVDGYCCAWKSLFLKLCSDSVVLKMESDYEQWYFHEITPWIHYIPLRPDLKDLRDTFIWLQSHDHEVQRIVQQAHEAMERINYERETGAVASLCAKVIGFQRVGSRK